MNRTANEWAGVKVAAVFGGSEAQARNVLQMALEDIGELAASRRNNWARHYDIPDHLGWDLRMIADRVDERAGYATMDASILRRAAECFDGLPENTSHDDALRIAREKAA